MSTNTANVVTVDIPAQLDRRITPNGRAHWGTRHKLQQELKEAAYYSARNANLEMWQPTPPLTMHYTIYHGSRRRKLDDTNAVAALKYVEDGIALALGIDDRFFRLSGVEQYRDPDGAGFIRVRIESEAA